MEQGSNYQVPGNITSHEEALERPDPIIMEGGDEDYCISTDSIDASQDYHGCFQAKKKIVI